ncbi:MAG: hypothetical protein GY866_10000 [Proteobacteria bacterium]|nr:hypothetical protein [Pseudomonadota bacterium]
MNTRASGRIQGFFLKTVVLVFLLGAMVLLPACKDDYDISSDGNVFNLDAFRSAATEEGSESGPTNITGNLPYEGQTGNQQSYYVLNDMTTDVTLQFTLANMSDDLDLYVYDDSGFGNLRCSSTKSETQNESCYFEVDTSSLYIKVDGYYSFSGSTFVFDVKPPPPSQGSASIPEGVAFGSLPYSGSVDTTDSYYLVTGLTASLTYKVTLTGLSDKVDLYVNNSAFPTLVPSCYDTSILSFESNDVECSATATGTSLYIRADGSLTDLGSFFQLNVLPPAADQGSAGAPLDITASMPDYSGEVGSGKSYYVVTGLTASQSYMVTVTEMDDDVDLEVYDDADLNTRLCSSSNWFTWDEDCSAEPSGSSLYLVVEAALLTSSSTFTVDVQ